MEGDWYIDDDGWMARRAVKRFNTDPPMQECVEIVSPTGRVIENMLSSSHVGWGGVSGSALDVPLQVCLAAYRGDESIYQEEGSDG